MDQKTARIILLVDDEPDVNFVVKQGLEKAGFTVDAFTDPVEALSRFKADFYDLLILDLRMPLMDGLTLYERIRQIEQKAKVCFMTAFDADYRQQLITKFPHLDVQCMISKPVAMGKIIGIAMSQLGMDNNE